MDNLSHLEIGTALDIVCLIYCSVLYLQTHAITKTPSAIKKTNNKLNKVKLAKIMFKDQV